jgi:hypothetical protein
VKLHRQEVYERFKTFIAKMAQMKKYCCFCKKKTLLLGLGPHSLTDSTSLSRTDIGMFPIPPSAFETNRFDFTVYSLCINDPVSPKDAR